MKHLKFVLLFWSLSIPICGITQTIGDNNEIINSFNITNITKHIQQLDRESIEQINRISDIDEKLQALLAFTDTLNTQISNLTALFTTNNLQNELIRNLIEERRYFVQVIARTRLLLDQKRQQIYEDVARRRADSIQRARVLQAEFAIHLFVERRNVYMDGRRLSTAEVRTILSAHPTALRLYNQGIQTYERGRRQTNTGIWLVTLGTISFVGAIAVAVNNPDTQTAWLMFPVGAIGCALIITPIPTLFRNGASNRNSGRVDIGRAVRTFNGRPRNISGVELNFGVTQNGAGLVLNF